MSNDLQMTASGADSQLFLKICGLAREEDVRQTLQASPDALGFVFWPKSPRSVLAGQVEAWTTRVPPHILKVGVFVNQPADEVRAIAETAGLDIVQLHGDEDSAYIEQLALPCWKAVHLRNDTMPDALPQSQWLRAYLIDSGTPEMPGGTGVPVNWEEAARLVSEIDLPVILAGGLTARNVRQAVETVRPWGVDTSSSVELEPGVKDMNSVRDFLETGRSLDVSNEDEGT